ncbi:MAG: TonB-dependent receptor plug domain-containing protein [Panacagrimonas sp.]
MNRRFAALSIACVACIAAAEDVVVLEPVVVTGRPPRADKAEEVAPRLVYEADELARFGGLTVGELIRRLPGVAFTSEAGQFEAPQLRGIGPEYTQFLIDGRRVPGLAEDRSAFVDRIPADLIERIEIVRSPTADLDAQGIGGSINVILRSGAAADGTRLRLGSVLDDSGKARVVAHAAYGASRGPWSGYLGLSQQPDHEARSKRVVVLDAEGEVIERRRGNEIRDARSGAADARGAYRFAGGGSLALDAQVLRTVRDTHLIENLDDEDGEPALFDEQEDEAQTTRGIALRTTLPLSAGFECATGADHTTLEGRRMARAGQTDAEGDTEIVEDELLRVRDREIRADGRCGLTLFGSHRLRFGTSLGRQKRRAQDREIELDEDGEPVDISPFGGRYRVDEHRLDGFVQALWALTPVLQLDSGLRLETTRRDQAALEGERAARFASDQEWLPNLHLRWSPASELHVRASVARTLRRPDFDQLVPFRCRVDRTFVTGNPDLMPETALGFDLGYEQRWVARGLSLNANLFHREIDDLIEDVSAGSNTRRPDNVGRGRAWGVELEGGIEFDLPGFLRGVADSRLEANLALLDSRVRDPETGESRRFQRQPAYTFNLAFDQDLRGTGLGWGVAWSRQGATRDPVSDQIEHARTGSDVEAYVSFDFGSSGFELQLVGRNLLDAYAVETTRSFEGPRGSAALESIDREREVLGPSVLLSLSASFR